MRGEREGWREEKERERKERGVCDEGEGGEEARGGQGVREGSYRTRTQTFGGRWRVFGIHRTHTRVVGVV